MNFDNEYSDLIDKVQEFLTEMINPTHLDPKEIIVLQNLGEDPPPIEFINTVGFCLKNYKKYCLRI